MEKVTKNTHCLVCSRKSKSVLCDKCSADARRAIRMKKAIRRENRKGAQLEFSPAELAVLKQMTNYGNYGKTPQEVARYLIRRQIDDLMRSGVLQPLDIVP